jgi:transcriptional regulator with XRE-family HTH domain
VLRMLREERGLSQREVARRVRRSNTTVSDWERGRHEPALHELPAIDGALAVPLGTLSSYHSGSTARLDLETLTLRGLLPEGALNSVTVRVHEDLTIDEHGVRCVVVDQWVHALRDGVRSYAFVWAQEPGPPRLRISAGRGCRVRTVAYSMTSGRMVQDLHFDRPALYAGQEHVFRFTVVYGDRANPRNETDLHRRVGTPTLRLLTMQARLNPHGGLVRQGTWADRDDGLQVERAWRVGREGKVLRWDRPGGQTCGLTWTLQ